jgi:hypothetical protein
VDFAGDLLGLALQRGAQGAGARGEVIGIGAPRHIEPVVDVAGRGAHGPTGGAKGVCQQVDLLFGDLREGQAAAAMLQLASQSFQQGRGIGARCQQGAQAEGVPVGEACQGVVGMGEGKAAS